MAERRHPRQISPGLKEQPRSGVFCANTWCRPPCATDAAPAARSQPSDDCNRPVAVIRRRRNFLLSLLVMLMANPTDWESRIGRRVRLRDLHALSAVIQSGSMAKAAKELGVTQ